MTGESKKNALRRMYWDTTQVMYGRRGMDLDHALQAIKTKGASCIICTKDLEPGSPTILVEHRIGGKIVGKTFRGESCIDCAKAARDLIDLRIKEAASK